MNEGNILADVPVAHVEANFADMYTLQNNLQARLNQLPLVLDYKHMANKCVYWGHCVRAETEELIEWLVNLSEPTALKEMQMEAIDIVHFVFNIGIEIGLTCDSVHFLEIDYEHQNWEVDPQRIRATTLMLGTAVNNLINLLPWKTWKTYHNDPNLAAVGDAFNQVLRANLMLCNACGLDRQAVINMYYAKNKVNHARQDNGY